jgi:thiamine transporter
MNNVLKKAITSSLFIALAVALEFVTKAVPGLNYRFPQGGQAFGISVVPLLLIGLFFGFSWGVLSGVIFGIVNFLLDGYFMHWGSFFFDYILAFGSLGITGLFKNANKSYIKTILAILLACFVRYLFHSLGGVLFFSEYAGEMNPIFYSFIFYNAPYTLTTTSLSITIILLIIDPLNKIKDNHFQDYTEENSIE